MRFFSRKLIASFSATALFLVASSVPSVMYAQQNTQTSYVPLAPITTSSGQPVTPSRYITDLFKIGIGVASGLAVLAIAYGGIRYMLSDVVTNKSNAIQLMKNALLGLGLALSAYLILYTISPTLTSLSILTTLDTSPPPAQPPPGSGGTLVYRVRYGLQLITLRFQKTEWELNYTSSLTGNPSRARFASTDKAQCQTDGGSAQKVGSYSCTLVTAYKRPQPSGYPSLPTYGGLLPSGAKYASEDYETETFAVKALCDDREGEMRELLYVIHPTYTGCNATSLLAQDIQSQDFASYQECLTFATLKNDNGFFVLGKQQVTGLFVYLGLQNDTNLSESCRLIRVN